jgi:hypothetical protein
MSGESQTGKSGESQAGKRRGKVGELPQQHPNIPDNSYTLYRQSIFMLEGTEFYMLAILFFG